MQLFAGLVVSLPFVVQADSNTTLYGAIIATDEEIAIQREGFDKVVADRAACTPDNGCNAYSTCSNDMRDRFPGCHQSGNMWCWATAVAAATEYYGAGGSHGDQCQGLECDVVSWTFNEQCCPFKAKDDACGMEGASWSTIQRSINHYTGRSWQRPNGPISQVMLDASLQAGNPVLLEIGDERSPSHVVTLHGCGSGKYWYHDPERDFGEFINVDYDWLLHQCVVWMHNGGNAILVPCQSGSAKDPDEIFRIERKWWDTLYIPGSVAVV